MARHTIIQQLFDKKGDQIGRSNIEPQYKAHKLGRVALFTVLKSRSNIEPQYKVHKLGRVALFHSLKKTFFEKVNAWRK